MTARENVYYLKEIVGTILWIALFYFLFHEEGLERCQEFLKRF